jgi:hypothetical protein
LVRLKAGSKTELLAAGRQGFAFDRASVLKAVAVSALAAGLFMVLADTVVPGFAHAPASDVLDPDAPFGSRPARLSAGMATTADLRPGDLPRDTAAVDARIRQAAMDLAKIQLARALQAHIQQAESQQTTAAADQPDASSPVKVPLPRARPPESQLVAAADAAPRNPAAGRDASAPAAPDLPLVLQKLSSLLPSGFKLASAAPDGGVSSSGQDLSSALPGYDRQTAVYDISAHVVYLPDGTRLEAHSGFGGLLDDPTRINEKNRGATPPHLYDLTLREKSFHGVQALRMLPVGEGELYGRNGLLAHSYMLGPNGDSNGCVSFKDYDAFLKAFMNGDVKHLLVVTSLSNYAPGNAGKA